MLILTISYRVYKHNKFIKIIENSNNSTTNQQQLKKKVTHTSYFNIKMNNKLLFVVVFTGI